MNRVVYYTHSKELSSEVIKKAYYSVATSELFLDLHNGTRVGYSDVPSTIYNSLTDPKASAGRVWNAWIKGRFTGINGDVDLLPAEEAGTPSEGFLFDVEYEVSFSSTKEWRAKTVEDAVAAVRNYVKVQAGDRAEVKIRRATVNLDDN